MDYSFEVERARCAFELGGEAMKQENKERWMKQFKPYRFRIIWTTLFFLLALLLLLIGFGKTLVLLIFAAVGYIIGKMRDEDLDIYSLIDSVRSMIGI
ncbi:hypothetical protein RV15_GL001308 [Enterococcus silesiacus]|uniref:DUF2273 domain-containing protein n=2 Tax=Enterococcus silesiacus TaxID=332949 RepID=A0AA91GDI8_9ENTE|nr:hypothetical protein RV15_GL001308 [Enterococcus silesiacus]